MSSRKQIKRDSRPGSGKSSTAGSEKRRTCKALTTSGSPCARPALPGLTVCKSHGGGTASSIAKSRRSTAIDQASLWGLSSNAGGISLEKELSRLAEQKLGDIKAIRIRLSEDPDKYYGMLRDSKQIMTTSGDRSGEEDKITVTYKSSVHPLVTELHKAESEVLSILRLLGEITGSNTDELSVDRLKQQTARQAARLMKAYPGMSVDDVAREVTRDV